MKIVFDKCQYCNNRPPMHELCINGRKTKTTGETVVCKCGENH